MKDLIKNENEKAFSDLVNKHLKNSQYEMKRESHLLQFVFKGKSEETEITVYCDPDELTFGIGEFYHTHFDIYSSDKETELEKYIDAGENAIGFIQAFMRNEIWLEVSFRGDEATSAAIFDEHDSYSTIIPVGKKDENKNEIKRVYTWVA